MITTMWLICCWVIPGNSGELLFQRLNVCKLDSLPPASGFDHITLKENECEGQSCPLKENYLKEEASGKKLP